MTRWKNANPTNLGAAAELIVAAEFALSGYQVFRPLVDDRGVDLLIDRGDGQHLLVQVKSSRLNYVFMREKVFPPGRLPRAGSAGVPTRQRATRALCHPRCRMAYPSPTPGIPRLRQAGTQIPAGVGCELLHDVAVATRLLANEARRSLAHGLRVDAAQRRPAADSSLHTKSISAGLLGVGVTVGGFCADTGAMPTGRCPGAGTFLVPSAVRICPGVADRPAQLTASPATLAPGVHTGPEYRRCLPWAVVTTTGSAFVLSGPGESDAAGEDSHAEAADDVAAEIAWPRIAASGLANSLTRRPHTRCTVCEFPPIAVSLVVPSALTVLTPSAVAIKTHPLTSIVGSFRCSWTMSAKGITVCRSAATRAKPVRRISTRSPCNVTVARCPLIVRGHVYGGRP